MNVQASREFTGKHLLFILVAFFGVIFAVNFTMAWLANSTWTGLVVPNSYIASQEFNGKAADAATQIARGWKYDLAVSGGRVAFLLKTETGSVVTANGVTVTFKRPGDRS
ncbi:MAG: FixH family protein [Phyllobacteriaceae bacterium]|nr:FixH family protein [Phyllobacteriaceae bacterium]